MGQYYKPALVQFGEIKVFDRTVKPECEYVMAKLMEHSWWQNHTCNAIAKMIYHKTGRLFWCGDYAEDAFSQMVWEWKCELPLENPEGFTLDGKYIVNWTKKQYIDCDEYKKEYTDQDGWTIHPLPLLTAQGNGLGGGDYHESNIHYADVGIWAGHEISIEDSAPMDFEKVELGFKEYN